MARYFTRMTVGGVQYKAKDAEAQNTNSIYGSNFGNETNAIQKKLAQKMIEGELLTAGRTLEGYKLLQDGKSAEDSDYNLLFYNVSSCDYIYVEIADLGYRVPCFQFQSDKYTPDETANLYLCSMVHAKGYTGFLIVPSNALWLAVCVSAGTTPVIRRAEMIHPEQNTDREYYTPEVISATFMNKDTGEFVDGKADNWGRTDFIEVIEGTEWSYIVPAEAQSIGINWTYSGYFDKDKNFIQNMQPFHNWVPFGAKYMVLCGPVWILGKLKIQNPINNIRSVAEDVTKKTNLSEMEIYSNYLDMNKIIENRWLAQNGYIIDHDEDGFFVTDFIRIPEHYPDVKMRYVFGCSLVSGTWGANARQVCFYDEKGSTISYWHIDDSDPASVAIREVPEGAEFVRICFKEENAYYYMVTFSTNTNLPHYDLYQPKIHGEKLPGLYNSITNSDGAITSMILTALDYVYNPEVHYSSNHTLFDDVCGGKFVPSDWCPNAYEGKAYQMDCSSFVQACMEGIRFANSRYIAGNDFNIEAPNAFVFDQQIVYENEYDDGTHPGKFCRIYANEMANYANKKGYLYRVNTDFSNVMPGDVIFTTYAHDSETTWYDVVNFRGIGHCALVVQKYRVKDGSYWLKTLECGQFANHWSGAARRIVIPGDGTDRTWAARFPIPDCRFGFEQISGNFTPESVSYSLSDQSTRVKVLQLPLTKNIRNKMCYTLMFKGEYNDDIWFEYWIGNHSSYSVSAYNIGTSNANILMRPDRFHVVHIELPMDIDINDGTKFEIAIRKVSASGTETGSVRITDAKLYEGYLTGNYME